MPDRSRREREKGGEWLGQKQINSSQNSGGSKSLAYSTYIFRGFGSIKLQLWQFSSLFLLHCTIYLCCLGYRVSFPSSALCKRAIQSLHYYVIQRLSMSFVPQHVWVVFIQYRTCIHQIPTTYTCQAVTPYVTLDFLQDVSALIESSDVHQIASCFPCWDFGKCS